MPHLLTTAVRVDIEAAAGEGATPSFRINAYTGAPMRLNGYQHLVSVDLATFKAERQSIPVLRSHDDDRVVGHTTSIVVGADGIEAAGVVSGTGADAAEVVANAKRGFGWQASIGAQPGQVDFVPVGKTASVNGRTVKGPHFIARNAELSEISFVARGADKNTSAAITARKDSPMPSELETENAVDEVTAERDRVGAIFAAAAKAHKPAEAMTIAAKAVEENWTVDKAELEMIRADRPKPILSGPAIHSRSNDSGLECFEAAALVRAGHEKTAVESYGERVVEAAGRFRGRSSFPDLLAGMLTAATGFAPHDRNEMIRAAVSNYSVQTSLSNITNKALLAGYLEAPAPWKSICAVRSAANFKPHTSIRPSFGFELEKIGKTGEIEHGTAGESTFEWRVDTYGKTLGVDRQDVVNDDLKIWDEVSPAMGKAAMRKVSDLFVSTLLAASSSYFHSPLGNLGVTAFDAAALGARIAAMRKMRDADDNDLDIYPRVLYVPSELEVAGKAALESEFIQRLATDQGPTGNALKGALRLESDSRLSNSAKFGVNATATQWYLFAGPSDAAIVMGFLDGKQTPTVEFFGLGTDPKVLQVQWRVFFDFGCALGDHRAAQKSTGAGS
jgi:hypothetical protein